MKTMADKTLYIAWNDVRNNKWIPVAMLVYDGVKYVFKYTEGAKGLSGFIPFSNMTDIQSEYISDDLLPFFSNRILGSNRPEFDAFLQWLNLDHDTYTPVDALALTEGKRETDSIEIFPCPIKSKDGMYKLFFFLHGLKYLHKCSIKALQDLQPGDRLFLLTDPQNKKDSNAIVLRSDDPIVFLGYCPRFLTNDFHELLQKVDSNQIKVFIKKINLEAPFQYKLLCEAVAPWPDGFQPCSDPQFMPIVINSINGKP